MICKLNSILRYAHYYCGFITILFFTFFLNSSVYGQRSCNYSYVDSTKCYIESRYLDQPFTIEKKVASDDYVNVVHTPLAGDIDGDCINEIFAAGGSSYSANKILIISGISGKTLKTIRTANFATLTPTSFCIADIDNDGDVEIILAASIDNLPENQKRLICYDLNGNIKWKSNEQFRKNAAEEFGNPSVADFNRDGIAEVYIFNEIFSGQTGIKLATGGFNGLGARIRTDGLQGCASIAADLDNDTSDLELAAGYTIYKVILTNTNGTMGNLMIPHNYNNRLDGYTSVADINGDNKLDVIVSAPNNIGGILYVYTLNNNQCDLVTSGFVRTNGVNNQIGPPVIGNISSTTKVSILVTTENLISSFSYNQLKTLQKDWEINTVDFSGHTGISLFDFDNDKINEIVFRDEEKLRIIKNSNNTIKILGTIPCFSWTQKEFPIITNVDATGESKICTTCSQDRKDRASKITIFGAKPGNNWAPCRGVWNQYNFNPLNINDDLTVPRYQENSAVFDNRIYNNFYTQKNIADKNGLFYKRAASIYGIIKCVNFNTETKLFNINFTVKNKSEASQGIGEGLYVSFYNGNPEIDGKLLKINQLNSSIGVGASLNDQSLDLDLLNIDRLYMVVNTQRDSVGSFNSNQFVQTECDYSDNISQLQIPKIEYLSDAICLGDSLLFFGKFLKENKIHYSIIKNTSNCDSAIFVLDLKVKNCPIPCNTPCCIENQEGVSVNSANLYAIVNCTDYDEKRNKINVNFSVFNQANLGFSAINGIPISIYAGDPNQNGKLLATYYTVSTLEPGKRLTNLMLVVDYLPGVDYYLVTNSDQLAPINFDIQTSECQYDDNVLKINLPHFTLYERIACYGDSIEFEGKSYLWDTKFKQIVKDKNGCDSTVMFIIFKFRSCGFDYTCDDKCYNSIELNYSKFVIKNLLKSVDTVGNAPILSYDINGDCIPEIITSGYQNTANQGRGFNSVLFIDSETGMTTHTIKTVFFDNRPCAYLIADVDRDGIPEVIIASRKWPNDTTYNSKLICYNLDNSIKWISNARYNSRFSNNGGTPNLADFNHDGIPEVYLNNMIFNAQTGKLLVDGGIGGGKGRGINSGGISISIAGELNGSGNLELAAGRTIYKVDINNTYGTIGNTMTPYNLPIDYKDGLTSLADIDEDGILDVITTSEVSDDQIGLYVFGFVNDRINVIASQYFIFGNNSSYRISSPKVYDLTGKGQKSILISIDNGIECYRYDKNSNSLIQAWSYNTESYAFINETVGFDVNGDGLLEIFIKKLDQIKILNEKNGKILEVDSISCKNAASLRIIGGNHQSYFCASCFESIKWIGTSGYNISKLNIFGAPDGQRWAPARGIWNQYAYNPLFINDDGTVPQYMHNPATYQNGKYNNFMLQESLIDRDGNYHAPAASLTGSIDCIAYDAATDAYLVTFSISNRADASLTSPVDVPISLYNGDPSLAGQLLTTYRTAATIAAGGTLTGLTTRIPASSTSGRLYLVVNTDRIAPLTIDSSGYQTDECDYTDNVYQVLLPILTTTTVSICTGETYTYYGRALTTSGTYLHEVTDSKGCDSVIVRLSLVVSDTKTQSLTQRGCEVYVWRDTTILSSGTYVQRDLSASGCDSITTLDLTIYPRYNAAQTASSCDSFSYAGVRYTQDAIILEARQSIYGCDSTTTIDLRIHPSITQDITRAACVNYTWDGTTYTDSGNYTYRGQTSMGCDSIVNLVLTISNVLTSTQAISGCDHYLWNSTTYAESGSYMYAATSVRGCDSIATLNLNIGKSQSLTERATACDSYRWNGQLLTASGDYSYTTTNTSGCDSTTVLSLTLHRSTTADIVQSSCNTYTWNGTTYTTGGNYSYLAQTANGCDSTVRLALTILAPDRTQAKATACGNYPWNGSTYDRSGSYTYQTLNSGGCDSTVTLELIIHPVAQSSMSLTACDSVVLHGRTLRASGDYRFELATQYGCDSIVTLLFTTQSDRQSAALTACDTYTWAATGDTYTQSGRYSASYTNEAGCDSTQVLNLQIAPSYLTTQNANACEQYTWPPNQTTYTESGDYTLRLKTQVGCDSIQTLALRIDPVFEYRDTVTSATTYTWPINEQYYEQTGVYREIYQSISVCDSVYWLHLTIKKDIDIYTPNILSTNGSNNYFTLFSNNSSVAVETMNIYDRWGNLIYGKQNFPLNDPSSGWDGKIGGRAVVPGVYVWVALLRLPDGSQVTKQGDVTVF